MQLARSWIVHNPGAVLSSALPWQVLVHLVQVYPGSMSLCLVLYLLDSL
jgi:hypothetical protein